MLFRSRLGWICMTPGSLRLCYTGSRRHGRHKLHLFIPCCKPLARPCCSGEVLPLRYLLGGLKLTQIAFNWQQFETAMHRHWRVSETSFGAFYFVRHRPLRIRG